MAKKIRIKTGALNVEAELNDSKTAQRIWDALPIEGRNNLWGEEIYFRIPVTAESDGEVRDVVSAGELGYWPPGHAFCIFFGLTPVSQGKEIRAASAVTILGKVTEDPKVFRKAKDGAKISIERA